MFKKTFLSALLLVFSSVMLLADTLRVACVGDSITYGSRIENRLHNAYPFQLGRMMGPGYEVKNFGVSGATLLRNGNKPYNSLSAFQEALQFEPDVVLIKLGTNDSKLINRPFFGEFKSDYHQLIGAFRNVNPEARIILLVPVPAFNHGEPVGISPETISRSLIPLIEAVAYEAGCEILDLYHVFFDREELFPDKIHPDGNGAAFMALRIQEALLQRHDPEYDLVKRLEAEGEEFNFHGFRGLGFVMDGLDLQVVRPWRASPDHSWIIRARFFGHEPQLDISLLERGFYLVYCDVADLYGSPEAVERWNSCYRIMLTHGLQCKVALEGFSRGGLIIYNWAASNPEKVSCIYADAPVLDIKSWPGGKGKGKYSQSDWQKCLESYGLETEDDLKGFKGSPMDNALILAKTGKPLLHVYGESDEVVPPEENTVPFAEKIRSSGGNIRLIAKSMAGHHPHSLNNPSRITEFILAATPKK